MKWAVDMTNSKTFRNILRYKIDPFFNADDRIEEIVQFCQDSQIEEVMLFLLAEELSMGHPTIEELEPYVVMGKQLKKRLSDFGIRLSLNPWTTTYHVGRGRILRSGQNFTLMVGETGTVSPITPCPLCPNWQDYICDVFRYLAGELEPVALWVEDDWRIHNHEPDMGWGGCFCQLHLARFEEKIGCSVSRDQVLENILAPGEPHPWRQIWLEICRDTLLEPAVKLYDSVHSASPATRLGLMTSSPDTHSAEGRDWQALQQALGDKPAFLVRPHMPPYTETHAFDGAAAVTRLTLANLHGPLEVYPELENSPRCGRYSKSSKYSLWQCFNAAVLGSNGITINHFDMMGNGIALDRDFGKGFSTAKPRLNSLLELGIDDRRSDGVKVLFNPQVSRHMHSSDGSTMHSLCQNSLVWSRSFYNLGIAHRFVKDIASGPTPYAISGQTLRAFDDQAIGQLLSGNVLLDAASVEILLDRGFGELIGIESVQWKKLYDVAFSYESIREGDPSVYGLANPRMTAQRCSHRLLDMKTAQTAQIKSDICRYDHKALFPGMVSYSNSMGGTIVSLAYPFDGKEQFFMGFFNIFRRIMVQRILLDMAGSDDFAFVEEPIMHIYRARTENGLLLAVFNVTADPTGKIVLRLPSGQINPKSLLQLYDDGSWRNAVVQTDGDGKTDRIQLDIQMDYLDGLFLLQPR